MIFFRKAGEIMKIIIINDDLSTKPHNVSDAVIFAALEKNINCEHIELSDFMLDVALASFPEYIKKISDHLISERADVVICTGIHGMMLMTKAGVCNGNSIFRCGIVSSYDRLPMMKEINMDCYFAPHEEIKNQLIRSGIEEHRIFVTGIPVKKDYREHIGKAAARNYLVIPKKRRIYLLIPEGLSCDDIERLCDELSDTESEDYTIYIPTARESPVRERLRRYSADNSHIQIITYTSKMNLYIESADAMLMKPDSLYSTEAAVSGVPLIHLSMNPDKTGRDDYFARHEMAVIGNGVRDTINKARRFVEEKAVAARMIQMQYRNTYSDAADKIIEIIIKKAQKCKRANA